MKSKLSFFLTFLLLAVCFVTSSQSKSGVTEDPRAVEALAKCLKATKATMYGTAKCGHCLAQKELFGQYFQYIRFVDCRRDKASSDECYKAHVGKFPQWNFTTTDKVIVREADLDTLAVTSGCTKYIAQALGGQESTTLPSNSNIVSDIKPKYISSTANTNPSSFPDISSGAPQTSSVYGNSEELAKCLKAKQVIFYGSPNCGHCNRQKEMFEGNFEKYLLSTNFHNCKGNASEKAECDRLSTYPFPTWVEKTTGRKLLGPERSLDLIANTFGCTLAARAASSPAMVTTSPSGRDFDGNPASPASNNTVSAQPNAEDGTSLVNSSGIDPKESNVIPTSPSVKSAPPNTVDELTKPLSSSPYQPASASPVLAGNVPLSGGQLTLQQIKQMKLATCLSTRSIKLYGITNPGSPDKLHLKSTQEQLQELGLAVSKITVIDCSDGKAECANLVLPTWVLENKTELPGIYDTSNFAQIIGCPIDR